MYIIKNREMITKKGQSEVVSMVLIVLIVVAAIAVIGIIFLKTANKGSGQVQSTLSCNNIVLMPKQCIYNNTNIYETFQIKFTSSINLVSLTLVSESQDGGSIVNSLSQSQISQLNNLQTASFLFSKNNQVNPAKKFFLYATLKNPDGSVFSCPASAKIGCYLPAAQGSISAENSPISGADTATFSNVTLALSAPNVIATAKSTSSINVSWTSVNNATGYAVYRSLTSGGTYTIVANTSALSYLDSGLSAGTTYYYKVSAYNAIFNVTSILSNYASSTTLIDLGMGLIFWMRFNNETGENSTFFKDWSGYGNNGTCTGSACPIFTSSGKWNGAYYFNASSLQNVQIPSSLLDYGGLTGFTNSLWFKSTSIVSSQQIFLSKHSGGSYGEFYMSVDSNTLIHFVVINSSTNRADLYATVPNINDGNWHSFVTVYNGTVMSIYFDGGLKATGTTLTGPVNTLVSPLCINGYGATCTGLNFNGTIDNIRIYNRALSPVDILALNFTE